ncbi:MAG: TlpA family protein disulfide reductase [Chloroflexi bacterium]|nr:TlpA family protein disulfide reductase [Chloroflexota bacterium]
MLKKLGLQTYALLILLAAAVWIAYSRVPGDGRAAGGAELPHAGFSAPLFSLATPQGGLVTLADLRGRPVIINFWATWCPPCREEMPALQEVYAAYKAQGLEILAVNATNQDDPAQAAAFAAEYGLAFPILLDMQGEVAGQYQIQSFPTTFFINSQGVIQEVVIGGPMAEALLRVRVEQLMQGGAP